MSVLMGSTTPRIWTPEARELTPATSLGFEVIDFATRVLGMRLYPWQEWLFIHGLELHPDYVASDPDPLFRFDTVCVVVSRQQGKTESIKVKKLWRIYVDKARTVIATAQDLGNSEKAWLEAVALAQSTPDLDAEIEHVDLTNGKKALRLVGGHQYRVAASGRRGARGWSADDLDLDELREHQSWESWGAATPTTLARPRSQVWAWSSAGDASSVVLWHLRAQAMLTAEGVDADELASFTGAIPSADDDEAADVGDSLALFEWSAHPKRGKWDRKGWVEANPALGHGLVTERKLAGAIRSASEWTARNEILCQWRPTAAGGPFPDGAWESGTDAKSDTRVDSASPIAICVDVSHDRGMAYVGMAALRVDGHVHVQVLAQRAGVEWVVPWLLSPDRKTRDRWVGVTWQLSGAPVSSLTDSLRETDLDLVEWSGADLARAHGIAYDLIRLPDPNEPGEAGKQLAFHLPQPVLDLPAGTAVTRPLGDGWVLDRRKSPHDAAPLLAVVGAVWVLLRPEEKPKKEPRIHEWPEELLAEMGRW